MDHHEEPILISAQMLAERRRDVDVDFAHGVSYAPRFTTLMIGALIGIFVWELDSGALTSPSAIVNAGALTRSGIMAGQLYRLFTATFLHGGFEHVIVNCISFYILGVACEHAFGTKGIALLYVVSGLFGNIVSMLLTPGPSVGASGPLFGLMGAIIVVLVRSHQRIPPRDKRFGLLIAAWAVYTLVIGALTPFVDNGAHVGGLVAGMALGYVLPVSGSRTPARS